MTYRNGPAVERATSSVAGAPTLISHAAENPFFILCGGTCRPLEASMIMIRTEALGRDPGGWRGHDARAE